MRLPLRYGVLVPAVVASLALALSGCGGDDDEPAAQSTQSSSDTAATPAGGDGPEVGGKVDVVAYMNSFCTSLEGFDDAQSGVEDAIKSAVEAAGKSGTTGDAVRDVIIASMDGVVAEFKAAEAKLAAAGYPDIDDGEEIARKIRDALAFGANVDEAKKKIEALDTSDIAKLQKDAEQIFTDLGEKFEHSTDDIEFLKDNKTMEEAFNKADQCA